MAWPDHFEPNFDDFDSLSYVETSPYLPTNDVTLLDCIEETRNVLWDFNDSFQVIRNISNKSKYDRLRDIAVQIDTNNDLYDKYYRFDSTETKEIELKTEIEYVFTFGKYKGYSFTEILYKDPSYIEWCRNNVSWFTH